jgi:predicted AlkP superfamily pyrophosphatase or phosphodiesterase
VVGGRSTESGDAPAPDAGSAEPKLLIAGGTKTAHRAGPTGRFGHGERTSVDDQPLVPEYAGACVTNVVPALLEPADTTPSWLPAGAVEADQVVLFVIDGLGWEQLQARTDVAPTLAAMAGGPITTVAPSTTATALTSIATGLTPGLHGVIGYRMDVDGEVLNVLRWSINNRDARELVPPEKVQPVEPFLGQRPAIVTKAEFERSGFTLAHLEGVRFGGYRMPSTLVAETTRLLQANEPFIYCYYEGIDKVAHEYGLAEHYDAELAAVDRLVGDLLAVLPPGACLVITSDHGQVDVGEAVRPLDREVMRHVALLSGEGRFRWLHARPGRLADLLEATRACHGDEAWVASRDEAALQGWFGHHLSAAAASRLGDVLIAAREPVAFEDPADTGPYHLVARHGSMTPDEMRVPLLAQRA